MITNIESRWDAQQHTKEVYWPLVRGTTGAVSPPAVSTMSRVLQGIRAEDRRSRIKMTGKLPSPFNAPQQVRLSPALRPCHRMRQM